MANLIEGTDGNDRYELRLVGTDGDDIMAGGAGHDVFLPRGGNNIVDGANTGDAVGQPGTGWNYYDQVDYDGSPGDYVFERQGDAVIVTRPDGGTDTLYNIDGFWFNGSQEWKPLSYFLPSGTEGDDFIIVTDQYATIAAKGGAGRHCFQGAVSECRRRRGRVRPGQL